MRKLNKKIEDWLSAVSFAEAGEFETAREILKENKRVLLALRSGQISSKTLKYAVNTCKRVGADLDILFISQTDYIDPVLKRFLEELQRNGINHCLMQKKGNMKQEILDYTDSHKEILFVVIESSDSLDADSRGKDKRLFEAWQNLKCPLVVVMAVHA
jgi:hypothetical protein